MSIPSIQSELNRKTLDTMEWLTLKLSREEVSKEQFSLAVDAVFMAVSGLVSEEFLELIHQADSLVRTKPVFAGENDRW